MSANKSKKNIAKNYVPYLIGLFCAALLIRFIVFFGFVQFNERYKQADSMDYHIGALMLGVHNNFHHPVTKDPIVWRTPAYPLYLVQFYKFYGITSANFTDNAPAQKASIIVQIILSSFIPLLCFALAFLLTNSFILALITGIIFVLHPGFVLASCYLLTDSLAMVFFLIFLVCFYYCYKQRTLLTIPNKSKFWFIAAFLFAIFSLATYTWLRPNGQFFALIAAGVLLTWPTISWSKKGSLVVIFLALFFTLLSPWYVRNYRHTGKIFFCPMFGPYLLTFSAPKILRCVTEKPLDNCLQQLLAQTNKEYQHRRQLQKIVNPNHSVVQEFVCLDVALPVIKQYPGYFILEWCKEVAKTTFDLYGSQLVAFANNTYTFDPLEEFLPEKLKLCLYAQPMHWFMRFICLIEFAYALLLWFGLLGGLFALCILPFIKKQQDMLNRYALVWLQLGLFIIPLLFMTGGFGYARLRMPVEPLLVILTLTFWLWFFYNARNSIYEAAVCPVAN